MTFFRFNFLAGDTFDRLVGLRHEDRPPFAYLMKISQRLNRLADRPRHQGHSKAQFG